MRPDYPLRTERLLLRPYEAADLDDFHATRSRPDVYRYLFADHLEDRAAAEEALNQKMTQTELTGEGQRLVLAAYWPEAGRVVGDVTLIWRSEEHRQGELGYVFNPEFHGRGLAREAAEQMLRIGFEDLKLHRVRAECDPRNEPSWRLMERLGMRREAHYRHNELYKGEWCDAFIYALLEDERAEA